MPSLIKNVLASVMLLALTSFAQSEGIQKKILFSIHLVLRFRWIGAERGNSLAI